MPPSKKSHAPAKRTVSAPGTPSLLQRSWTWIVRNKEWVFSGIGVALLMTVLSYFLSRGNGTSAGRDVNTIENSQGPAVIQTGKGNITIKNGDQP